MLSGDVLQYCFLDGCQYAMTQMLKQIFSRMEPLRKDASRGTDAEGLSLQSHRLPLAQILSQRSPLNVITYLQYYLKGQAVIG